MAILQPLLPIAANSGVTPNLKMLKVTDNLATLTAAGYLTFSDLQGYTIGPEDEVHVRYNASATDENQGNLIVCRVTVTNGVIQLVPDLAEGNVELPVVINDFAVFADAEGKIKDKSFSASDATKTKVVMANSATVVDNFATFVDIAGTVKDSGFRIDYGVSPSVPLGNDPIIINPATGVRSNSVIFVATKTAVDKSDRVSSWGIPADNQIQVNMNQTTLGAVTLAWMAITPNP